MFAQRAERGFLTGGAAGVYTGTLDVAGVITAPAGVVGNVTGNLTGNVTGNGTGLVDGLDIDSRAPLASPTFTGTVTTAAINVTALGVVTSIGLSGTVAAAATSPAQIGADQTDYTPGATLFQVVVSDATRAFNSIVIVSGRVVILVNANTAARNLTMVHESASGTAIFKLACPTAANFDVTPGRAVMLFYDAAISRIRVIPF